MSSAILYVAIVAIWIGVLVPRWLRHDNSRDSHTRLRRFSRHRESGDIADWAEDAMPGAVPAPAGPGWPGGEDGAVMPEGPGENFGAYLGPPVAGAGPVPSYETAEPAYETAEPARPAPSYERPARGPGERSAPRRGNRQARMVMARRRMLMMLIVLSMVALGLACLGAAAWWVVMPPAGMLSGYVMLLREAARADAELRQHHEAERAAVMARMAGRARDAERAAAAERAADTGAAPAGDGFAPMWPAHEPLPQAEIIDISAHVGDQLYDQYADAKLRAVGD